MNPLAIVTKFLLLLDGQKDYNAAALFLDDNFEFVSPKKNFKTKADWIEGFPVLHKDPPIFELPKPGSHSHQVLRNGKKKFGPINVSLVESYEISKEGKIERLSVNRA
ncbi:unnamed protein product [Cylindrotheca closterium]|uniref:Uncharacterized protein n=1 Tax=Cylindrotheca closterium TaxID=2856 RepID=A0AAD2G3U7_9STRA|nr:unnamed protein product [Cylindrotheca closterium]